MKSSSALLTAALLVGCGVAPHAVAPASLAAAQAQSADLAVQKLIASVQAIKSYDAPTNPARIHLYEQLGRTDSDRAADFLLSELGKYESWSDAEEDALEQPLLDALNALAAPSPQEGALSVEAAGKKSRRRFNVWDGINRFFGVKKKRRKSGGGGPGPAPAPRTVSVLCTNFIQLSSLATSCSGEPCSPSDGLVTAAMQSRDRSFRCLGDMLRLRSTNHPSTRKVVEQCRMSHRTSGRASRVVCVPALARIFIRAGLRGWILKACNNKASICRCRPSSSVAGSRPTTQTVF